MKKAPVYMLALMLLLSGCNGENTRRSENPDSSSSVSDLEDISAATAFSEDKSETITASEATAAATSTTTVTELTESNPQLEYTRDVIRENGCAVGAAFIGYIDSELSEDEIGEYLENSETTDVYSYLDMTATNNWIQLSIQHLLRKIDTVGRYH